MHYQLQNTKDITNYFHLIIYRSKGDKLVGRALNSIKPGSLQESILSAAREVNDLEEREEAKKKRQALPEKNKKRYS